MDVSDRKREIIESLTSSDSAKVEMEDENDSEVTALLPPRNDDANMTRKPEKTRRSVQWNDRNGNQLAEILEFQASDVSDSDEDDSDFCTCRIM